MKPDRTSTTLCFDINPRFGLVRVDFDTSSRVQPTRDGAATPTRGGLTSTLEMA